MGKNSFKKDIRERYKGRGNSWIKFPKDSTLYNLVLDKIKDYDAKDYLNDIQTAGFAWARFITPTGTETHPQVVLEVRYRGSKQEQPDCTLTVDDSELVKYEFLGNTPFKLDLEKKHIKPKKIVAKKPKIKKAPKKEKFVSEEKKFQDEMETTITETLVNIREAKLDKATNEDLIQWTEFLKSEGLLKNAN